VAHVRVSTAFNRVLALEGALVESVQITDELVVVSVRRRARRHRCPCGFSTRARYDVSRRRWRHLDMGAKQVWLEADIARIDCRACDRVRTEEVPWARPGARCSRDFEDMIAWLAQRMDKSAIATLMRCAWRTVDATVRRLVAEHLDPQVNPTRLDGLVRIGVDEISYKRGHKFLTVIADHDTGRVVWVAKGRTQEAFEQFTTALGPQRRAAIQTVTMDMSHIYRGAVEKILPHAQICYDPYHVIKWANESLDRVFQNIRTGLFDRTQRINGQFTRKDWRKARFLLRAGSERLTPANTELLHRLRAEDLALARAWELKEGLRDLYQHIEPGYIRRYLHAWCTAATQSAIPAFVVLARRIRKHFDGIAAAVEQRLSNSRLEGINTKIRVIQRRGYGHRHPDTLAAMIHLCIGGITPKLPTQM
jgi:transposase